LQHWFGAGRNEKPDHFTWKYGLPAGFMSPPANPSPHFLPRRMALAQHHARSETMD